MKRSNFQHGAIAADALIESIGSTPPYRLGDCILGFQTAQLSAIVKQKLSPRRTLEQDLAVAQKPRINGRCSRNERDAWLSGFAVALAEIHRLLLNGNNSSGVCEVARNAGVTIKSARAAGVSAYDLKELKKAGVP